MQKSVDCQCVMSDSRNLPAEIVCTCKSAIVQGLCSISVWHPNMASDCL